MSHSTFENSGVCAHSMPTRDYVIFSVSPKGDTVLNEKIRALYAFGTLSGFDVKTLIGSYKGKLELSFLVSAEAFELIKARGYVADQESFLVLGGMDARGRRAARLTFQTERADENLGYFGALTYADADKARKHSSAWTYDIESGLTYIASHFWPNPYAHPGF